ncbi:TPA: hypothetical protein OND39_004468 [Enterobacter asburiae]|nr:hypothetical protein [Enterobacter asburiae]
MLNAEISSEPHSIYWTQSAKNDIERIYETMIIFNIKNPESIIQCILNSAGLILQRSIFSENTSLPCTPYVYNAEAGSFLLTYKTFKNSIVVLMVDFKKYWLIDN